MAPRLVTVAGPPAVGKTSVILRALDLLRAEGLAAGVVKFDSLSTADRDAYARHGFPIQIGLSGGLCPDHYFVTNIEACLAWGQRQGLDLLVSESAGLCNRCSPHIEGVLAVCVVDALAGIHTPKKIGPMLRLADLVVVTTLHIVPVEALTDFALPLDELPRWRVRTPDGLTLPVEFRQRFGREVNIPGLPMT